MGLEDLKLRKKKLELQKSLNEEKIKELNNSFTNARLNNLYNDISDILSKKMNLNSNRKLLNKKRINIVFFPLITISLVPLILLTLYINKFLIAIVLISLFLVSEALTFKKIIEFNNLKKELKKYNIKEMDELLLNKTNELNSYRSILKYTSKNDIERKKSLENENEIINHELYYIQNRINEILSNTKEAKINNKTKRLHKK